jgi:cell division protein FtsZ
VQQTAAADVQRRLSEALQAGLQGTPQSAVGPATQTMPISYQSQQPMPLVRQQRESWTAPNNVSIEEGFAHIGVGSQGGYQSPGSLGHSMPQAAPPYQPQAYNTQGFQPAAPVEPPRSSRRMPAVEDFPAVGQRDWHAKQSGTNNPVSAAENQRKSSFFGRISGLGRKAHETGKTAAAHPAGSVMGMEEDPPLPVFFGRERR